MVLFVESLGNAKKGAPGLISSVKSMLRQTTNLELSGTFHFPFLSVIPKYRSSYLQNLKLNHGISFFRDIFLVVFFDVILFTVVLMCCVKRRMCCFRGKTTTNEDGSRKGVEEGLHRMFKVAMFEKMEEDRKATTYSCFNIKPVT